jgi:hypothetical protein
MLGAYLIRQAKKYIAEWCGGDTEAYILRPHGHYDIRNGIAKDLEERLGEIEERLQIIASMCFDGRVGNGLVEQNGTLLMELIKQSRPVLAQEA